MRRTLLAAALAATIVTVAGAPAQNKEQCTAATTLLARLALQAPTSTPYELLISTRPPIRSVTSLLPPVSDQEVQAGQAAPFPAPTAATPVVGGVTFTDAPALRQERTRTPCVPASS
jgi:hypothetical protein